MGGTCSARESGPSTGSTKSQIKDQAAPNKYLPTRRSSTRRPRRSCSSATRPAAPPVAFPSLPSTETLESLATFDGRRSPSAFTAVSAGHASKPKTPPKEREKRDSLLCDGDTVDAVLGSVFD